ncbi:MAG: hypothetical protein A4E61_00481 [Syntrophorhabdus sp. PtaB.Bin184]|nr:MAG: hypothetical protein A4E61_00481 [Syntrophorhabdus sp. PtaB.Bin184]
MSSPYVLEVMPDQQLAGREILLSQGSRVQIYPATPNGSYIIRCLLPVGAEMTMGLSNEAAAALLVALMKEFDEGKLQAGFELLDTQTTLRKPRRLPSPRPRGKYDGNHGMDLS